jgi:hypothetical protein
MSLVAPGVQCRGANPCAAAHEAVLLRHILRMCYENSSRHGLSLITPRESAQ